MEEYRNSGDTDRLENIASLQDSIIVAENNAEDDDFILSTYLQEIALYTNMDIIEDKYDRVKLMTIHSSKGLEFPCVFLYGCSEGILPHHRSCNRLSKLEEERRLAYVAITRAEKYFYMTESEGYNFLTETAKYPSRFIFEIEKNFYVQKGILKPEIVNEAKEYIQRQEQLIEKQNPVTKKFQVNDLVIHPMFGEGMVISVIDEEQCYKIQFEEDVIRLIRFVYSKLKLRD